MRSVEDKGCLSYGQRQDSGAGGGGGGGGNRHSHPRAASGKPTPSKWDDAQKWLKHEDYTSEEDEVPAGDVETKKVECDDSIWRINKAANGSGSVNSGGVRSICVRDMGTEMTPIASQEPSRTATPIRATTPAARSPISSGSSTPVRCQNGVAQALENGHIPGENRGVSAALPTRFGRPDSGETTINDSHTAANKKLTPLETRAAAWDEAERAKYTARYKREEVKIQAWENREKRKAEMEMRRKEVKAESMKARAQEKYTNKVAATRRIAEEKRANAEAKLNESAAKTSEKADYIRRTGHLPSSFSFSFKLPTPSFCW
nr:remorin 1.4 [Ipomoea batatas]